MKHAKNWIAVFLFSTAFALGFLVVPSIGAPGDGSRPLMKVPTRMPKPIYRKDAINYEPDTILLMPSQGSEKEDIDELIKSVNGTIVETIGEGEMTVLKVRVEKGKLAEAEKTLGKEVGQNKDFSVMQRNWARSPQGQAIFVNDPHFSQEWYIRAIRAQYAWPISQGRNCKVAVTDTGTNYWIADLQSKSDSGYDAFADKLNQYDHPTKTTPLGHGTQCATTIAAVSNNQINTAGVAPEAGIYPICVINPATGYFDDAALIKAIKKCQSLGIKIINLSASGAPPLGTYANSRSSPALHRYMQRFHAKGGLIFNSAGNDAMYDPNPRLPYLIVVAGIDPTWNLVYHPPYGGSNYGEPLWFSAPGENLFCSDKDGQIYRFTGTSAAAPVCAGIAALIWAANPALTNTQVEQLMIQSCRDVQPNGWNRIFGFGVPNAETAVQAAASFSIHPARKNNPK